MNDKKEIRDKGQNKVEIKDLEIVDLDKEELEKDSFHQEDLEDRNMEEEDLNDSFPEEGIELEEEEEENKPKSKFNLNLILLLIIVGIVVFAAIKLVIWDKGVKDDTDVSINNPEFDVESMDYILPLNPKFLEGREDDGITTVVCFGNAPFSDDRGEDNNLTALIQKELGEKAKVYNCSIPDSYMTAMRPAYNQEHLYDAFSFYWMTTAFAADNMGIIDSAMETMETVPAEVEASIGELKSIDFNQVDIILVMYDGSDYLAGRKTINDDNKTDIQYFTGALSAGIQLIQNTYPHIRIMVMSPTYAYGLDENGQYQSSDLIDYGMGPLSTYAILESNACYENSVSFIDNIYASVNEDNADEYLEDNIHLNEKGRQLLARRFVECLNLYKGVAAEN